MSHIWIEVEGPHEVVTPLPGTLRSLPTWYWYILPHQFDDFPARLFFGLAGIDAQSVKSVSLGGDPGGTRSGEVVEGSPTDARYTWTETSQLYPEPDT